MSKAKKLLTQLNFIVVILKNYKRRAVWFAFSIVLAGILELTLVSFFYSLTNLLIGNEDFEPNLLGYNISVENFGTWFLFVAALATIVRILIIIFQANNMAAMGNGLVRELYEILILKPLVEFKQKPDSEIISLLTTKVQHCIDNIFVQIAQIIGAITISLGIVTALVIINAKMTAIVFCALVLTYFLIMTLSKIRLRKASLELSKAHDSKNNQLLNTLNNVESIMAYGEFNENISSFALTDAKLRESQKTIAIFGSAPRFLIEGILIIITAIPLLYFTSEKDLVLTDVAFLGAFMVGAVRILPLVNQIYAGLNSIRGSEHIAIDLMNLIKTSKSSRKRYLSQPKTPGLLIRSEGLQISLQGFKFYYPDFSLQENKTLAIVGKSGSGKSKLLHTILGLIDIEKGILANACFDPQLGRLSGVGYASQSPIILNNSVSHVVAAGGEYVQTKIDEILEIMSLKNELFESKLIGERGALLSGGQLQRLALCNALYRSSRLLILDEPTSALNEPMSENIMSNIIRYCRQKKIAIICVTHNKKLASMFDQIIEIK